MKTVISLFIASALLSTPVLAHEHKEKGNNKHNTSTGDLPPGLQKKVDRGDELPPGWQKKVQVGEKVDEDIYRHRKLIGQVNEEGIATVKIGDKMIRVMEKTREVLDILN